MKKKNGLKVATYIRCMFLLKDDDDTILRQILPRDENLGVTFGFGNGTGHTKTKVILQSQNSMGKKSIADSSDGGTIAGQISFHCST
jgi:hypothetical protein